MKTSEKAFWVFIFFGMILVVWMFAGFLRDWGAWPKEGFI